MIKKIFHFFCGFNKTAVQLNVTLLIMMPVNELISFIPA